VVESRKKLFDLRDETKEHISTIYTELKEGKPRDSRDNQGI